MAEKIKISFGKAPEEMNNEMENESPEMEAKEHGGMSKEEHDAHMIKMEQGLKQILSTQDINEIKQIAQSLLGEEEHEEGVEKEESSLNEGIDKILAKGKGSY